MTAWDEDEFEPTTVVDKHGLASMTGLSPNEIDAATREGMPVHGERARGKSLRYNVPDCVQWLLERAGDTIGAARQRQAIATARKREAEAERMEGKLVNLETVESAIRDGVAAWRSAFLSIPARVPADVRDIVRMEVEAAINSLAVDIPKMDAGP